MRNLNDSSTSLASNGMTLQQARDSGYRIISRRHRRASRIDTAGWREHAAIQHGLDRTFALTQMDGDWYRRCLSRDKIIVPGDWLGRLPNSGHSINYYVELVSVSKVVQPKRTVENTVE